MPVRSGNRSLSTPDAVSRLLREIMGASASVVEQIEPTALLDLARETLALRSHYIKQLETQAAVERDAATSRAYSLTNAPALEGCRARNEELAAEAAEMRATINEFIEASHHVDLRTTGADHRVDAYAAALRELERLVESDS